jgi:hypothetical protein
MGDGGGTGPRSERGVAGGWELLDCGAGCEADGVWMYRLGGRAVRIALEHEGRGVMRVVPCEVLAHVLRVQGYAVQREAEAAE